MHIWGLLVTLAGKIADFPVDFPPHYFVQCVIAFPAKIGKTYAGNFMNDVSQGFPSK